MNIRRPGAGHRSSSLVGGLAVGFVARGYVAATRPSRPPRRRPAASSPRRAPSRRTSSSRPRRSRSASSGELEEEGRAKRAELGNLERRLLQRDEQLDQRTDMLEERDRKLLVTEQELETKREELGRGHARSRSRRSSASAR